LRGRGGGGASEHGLISAAVARVRSSSDVSFVEEFWIILGSLAGVVNAGGSSWTSGACTAAASGGAD